MKRIERDKNRISAFRAVLSATGMLALMGCGKTVVDTTVEQQPTQTVETTVGDPVVDVPVEPTTDVSDNTTPVEDDKPAPTFVMTGENNYILYVDCPDESNAPEIQQTISACGYDSWSGSNGVSSNLVNAILTNGMQTDPLNAAGLNYDLYKERVINIVDKFGFVNNYVITDDPAQYRNMEDYVPLYDLSYNDASSIPDHVGFACTVVIKDSINQTNGNISLALMRYHLGPEVFDQWVQECVDGAGLTREEIYAGYDAEFVSQYDTLGLADVSYVNDVLRYVDGEIVVTQYNEMGQVISTTTCVIGREKTYGSR